MRKQILSVCLSLTIMAASGTMYGMQVRASEAAAEGASVQEAVPAETEKDTQTQKDPPCPADLSADRDRHRCIFCCEDNHAL